MLGMRCCRRWLFAAGGVAPGESGDNSADGGEVDLGEVGGKPDAGPAGAQGAQGEGLDARPGDDTGMADTINPEPPPPPDVGGGKADAAPPKTDVALPADAMPSYPQCSYIAMEVVYCGGAVNERNEPVYQLNDRKSVV